MHLGVWYIIHWCIFTIAPFRICWHAIEITTRLNFDHWHILDTCIVFWFHVTSHSTQFQHNCHSIVDSATLQSAYLDSRVATLFFWYPDEYISRYFLLSHLYQILLKLILIKIWKSHIIWEILLNKHRERSDTFLLASRRADDVALCILVLDTHTLTLGIPSTWSNYFDIPIHSDLYSARFRDYAARRRRRPRRRKAGMERVARKMALVGTVTSTVWNVVIWARDE